MDRCDVLIVGGGPAGSACAWALCNAGIDVVVIDRMAFPRDKPCAGWITPQVIEDLRIDTDAYRARRTFQPINGFRVGLIGSDHVVDAGYDRPVSFGIRRCEFDDYLLRRSGARLHLGAAVSSSRRRGQSWVINESVEAPMLVGAGGHFCPVARMLNGAPRSRLLITAQEVEFPIDGCDPLRFAVAPERPEIYFCPDLDGYGWCFRKQDYVNIGFGRVDAHALPAARAEFVAFLQERNAIPGDSSWRWHGHAYLMSGAPRRRIDDGILLVGDSAGLAYPSSGEGIRPAIESGLLAAATICDAAGRYGRDRLERYEQQVRQRFDSGIAARLSPHIPRSLTAALGRYLVQKRRIVPSLLDWWFLHVSDRPLAELRFKRQNVTS